MSLEDSDPKNPPRPIPEITKSDNGLVDIGRDDLVPREKKRLGQYIAYLTKVVYKNEYPISPDLTEFKLRTPSGNPMPVTDEPFGAEKTYTQTLETSEGGQKAKTQFEELSNSGMLDTDTPFQIKKGKSDDNKKTGTEYFREIDEKLGDAEIPRRVSRVQVENNRFNEASPAFTSGQREGVDNSVGSLILQPVLGQHAPGKFPKKAFGDGGDYKSISIEKLKQFGIMSILNASGEANVPVPGEFNDYLGTLERNMSTAVPGLSRLGIRVDANRFDTVKLLNEIEPSFKKEIRDKNLQGRTVMSYGNVNSVLVPFDGLASASSINSAAALGLTVSGMLKSLYLLLTGLSADQKNRIASALTADSTTLEDARKLRLGSFQTKDSLERAYSPFNESSGLNLIATKYDYFECVNKGIEVFFYGQVTSARDVTLQVQKSHGYFNVIFRNLVRSTSDILVGLVNSGTESGRSPFDVDPNLGGSGNVITDLIDTALGVVKIVNNSKLLKFMNIMAVIGETAIIAETVGENSTIDSISDDGVDDEGEPTPRVGILHAKNRLSSNFNNKLAWGKGTIRSLYLLPSELITAAQKFDGNSNRFTNFSKTKGFRSAAGSNRFSSGQVEAFEKYLEADYMPFYFHDLRTNEIIAFHAFLENIGDNYTVDYSENEGYGRVGKIYTYKNTNRNIDLSFSVVATSIDDFDEMWWSINKLITLLYPQYTEGRNLRFGNDSFTQPFSQLPAASPLIRLRLGDIFKSNYNKFNLARIFGVGQNNFFIQNQEQRQESQEQIQRRFARLDEIKGQQRRRMKEQNWQVGDKAILPENWMPTWTRGHSPISAYRRILVEGNTPLRQGTDTNTELRITSPRKVRIESVNTQRASAIGVTHEFTVSLTMPNGDNEEGMFTVSPYLLQIDEDYLSELAQRQVASDSSFSPTEPDTTQQDSQAIRDFFATSGESPNPIFKSFDSVRGKGLAGFIKGFNLEIDQKFPWETVGINNRAPKMVKISLQFLPIHDLQPGLDSNGFNTAPIYNVGGMMRKLNSDDAGASIENDDQDYRQSTNILIRRNGNNKGNV